MIQIQNLTAYQVEMLDHMWSLDSLQEYEEWYDLLDEEDQILATSLQQMILLAEMDEIVGECKDAKQLLKKFAL